MSEEEKKAIEELKINVKYVLDEEKDLHYTHYEINTILVTILNLIEKQEKEIENLKKLKKHQKINGELRKRNQRIESRKICFANVNIDLEDMQKYIDEKINNIIYVILLIFCTNLRKNRKNV